MKDPTMESDQRPAYIDFAALLAGYFWHGYLVMLAFGLAHSGANAVPAFGYWTSVFITFAASGIVAVGHYNTSRRVQSLTPNYGKRKKQVSPVDALAEALAKLANAKNN